MGQHLRTYDRTKPILFCHVPKCGGVSVRDAFGRWYGENLFVHYSLAQTPERDLTKPPFSDRPTIIFAHFDCNRGMGTEQLYPTVDQFLTMLRDPFEHSLSGYFYALKRNREDGKFPEIAGMSLEEFMLTRKRRFFHQLPPGMRHGKFRECIEESFVSVGILERLEESMQRFADALGFVYEPGSVPHLNQAPRSEVIDQGLKEAFIKRHREEYELYNHVLAMYE